MCAPTANSVAGARASIAWPGKRPAKRQSAARPAIAASENRSTSLACSAASLRGRPRNGMPKARTKQAAASAAVSATPAPTAGARIFSVHCGKLGLSSTDCRIIHSETKPLSGGRAEIAAAPTSMKSPVAGMRLRSPPSRSSRRSPVAVRTAPGAEEQQALEQRVVEGVQQRGGHRQRRRGVEAAGVEGVGEAEADEDEADVLDRAVGEHALEVVVHQRLQDADEPARRADDQHGNARAASRAGRRDRRRRG